MAAVGEAGMSLRGDPRHGGLPRARTALIGGGGLGGATRGYSGPSMKFSTEHATDPQPAPMTRSELPVCSPYPWAILLRTLEGRLIPGRETLHEQRFLRLDTAGAIAASVEFDAHCAQLVLTARSDVRDAASAGAARLFRPAEDTTAASAALASDPLLGPRIAAAPGLRPLGGWRPFELCVRTLVGQQVSVKAARSLIGHLAERCGGLEPERLASADLAQIGMPGRRVAAIQGFAAGVASGDIDLASDWTELEPRLAEQPGFGPWTRAYLGIRLGRDPDAFPASDVGLLRAAGIDRPRDLERLAERWRPHRALAATYLWMVPPGQQPAD
jgi:DNA-3-methyladenine glycosylase II